MAARSDSGGGDGAEAAGPAGWDGGQMLDTPLGRELQALARRILGTGPGAESAVAAALAEPSPDRLRAIHRTAIACRRHGAEPRRVPVPRDGSLAQAVDAELELASARLPHDQREALALRGLTRLAYPQIGHVMALEVPAVARLLAQARLDLREQLRGPYPHEGQPCPERDRALGILARRLDSEPLDEADDGWILPHMAQCPGCERAHAVMLEASFRYRAWARR